jgi:small subunit ribosomal protein S20
MANTSSAKKAAKQNEKRRVSNLARRTAIKTAIKKVLTALESKEVDPGEARKLLKDVAAKLARAKSKDVMHPNTAARKLSRLAKRVNKQIQPG